MILEGAVLREGLVAQMAGVGPLARVQPRVLGEVAALREAARAEGAGVRPRARVRAQVLLQVAAVLEAARAAVAHVRARDRPLRLRVPLHVRGEARFQRELFLAKLASERLGRGVRGEVTF